MSDSLYPISLKLEGRAVAVVGGGRVGAQKLASLLSCGARVTVIAPRVVAEVAERAEQGEIDWIVRPFEPEDLDHVMLAVAATGDVDVNREVVAAAHERRLLVNAVDDPERCDFYLPAVVRRGPLTVSVSTAGASPALARDLAREIGGRLPAALADLTRLFADARAEIQRRHPDEPAERRRLA
ncbi:MAG: bifunctional precorrin-2 dehydrogenase/sirohydrochlorin ferrochelatase, partial [Myxococcota bacterium]|nr:bifunctional precorrin-2 dehydrogenase/sirohydrochlorin ferrochelatase [Myxococcota bacterium]